MRPEMCDPQPVLLDGQRDGQGGPLAVGPASPYAAAYAALDDRLQSLDSTDLARLVPLREASWARHGKTLACYLPGMFVVNGKRGRYPALSLTGHRCDQHCAHCDASLLRTMPDASDPDKLPGLCRRLEEKGALGVLLTGGCDGQGRLPWDRYLPAIARVCRETRLHVSVHCGLVDRATARALAGTGVAQALIDVIGSPATYEAVYGLKEGARLLEKSLEALTLAGLEVVPHIVAGLHFGQLLGEYRALSLVARYRPRVLVLVVLMNLPGTAMANITPPGPGDLLPLFARVREELPDTIVSLGCARSRRDAVALEQLALLCGFNRMALPSGECLDLARELGVTCTFQATCCSVDPMTLPETPVAPGM